ncbi:MAG: hypothetical protein H0W81_06430 [Chloroflexi bacterium]|nr:hypothetical protein [Chloroflexota bacterium]
MKASLERIACLSVVIVMSMWILALLALLDLSTTALVICAIPMLFAVVVTFALARASALGDEMVAKFEAEWPAQEEAA